MRRSLTEVLEGWVEREPRQMGEVLISRMSAERDAGGYKLLHVADRDRADLQVYQEAGAARQISLATGAGEYRPLKTAPNLRRGWALHLQSAEEVRRALDLLYPAMLGLWFDVQEGAAVVLPLRAVLARQSGMYAVTRKLTDEQAQELVGRFCRSSTGCLKTILWPLAEGVPLGSLPAAKFDLSINQNGESVAAPCPMPCHEACNLLVAEARVVVKGAASAGE